VDEHHAWAGLPEGARRETLVRPLIAARHVRHPAIPSDVPSVPPLTVPEDEGEIHARTTAAHHHHQPQQNRDRQADDDTEGDEEADT
jgi:hypothetical protein